MKSTRANELKEEIFGSHATALRRAGLAVLPAEGKKPIRSGFARWKQAPGIKAVERWAQLNPNANIVYVPRLSRTAKNPDGLIVVDADNPDEVARAEELFGPTPAMINARRGRHFIYRAEKSSLGKVGSLRRLGFDIDIKHGQHGSGISVAPPSRHPDQADFAYSWHAGSGPDALNELPLFKSAILSHLFTRGSSLHPNDTQTAPPLTGRIQSRSVGRGSVADFRQGSRKLGLNDYLAKQAPFCGNFDECIDVARTWNCDLERRGIDLLPEDEVLEAASAAWRDVCEGRLVRTHSRRSIATTDADEVRFLSSHYDAGESAFMLLMLFRAEHTSRCLRGETFRICINAMVAARTMGRWSARKYKNARDILLAANLIEEVESARGGRAAKYRLLERLPTPSIDSLSGDEPENYTERAVRFKSRPHKISNG